MTGVVSLPGHFSLVSLDTIDSTNEEAKRRAADGARDGTVVWARQQTAGRGRRDRAWVSEAGNLFFSLLLRPDYPAAEAMQLSFVAANAVADAFAVALPRGSFVSCKWPNDVLVEGRKAAGLLLESASDGKGGLSWLVIGIGINIANHPQDADFPATSLHAEGAGEVTEEKMLRTICLRFLAGLVMWRNLGFAPVRKAWLARAHGLGSPVTVRLGEETMNGVFHALDETGALVLRQDGVERLITAGDVFFSAS